jgi:SAM-dependent methyltransferase/glycosyltransferase involved in cell wall biosynthesis
MRVVFAINADPREKGEGWARLASARYRGLIPAQQMALQDPGLQVEVIGFPELFRPDFDPRADLLILHQPKLDVVSFSQSFPACLERIDDLRAAGGRLVIDVSDFKLAAEHDAAVARQVGEDNARLYRKMLEQFFRRCDAVTTPSDTLAGLMREALERLVAERAVPVSVIGDPIEVERRPVRFAPGDTVRLLWFGFYGIHAPAMRAFFQADLPRLKAALAPQRRLHLQMLCEPLAPDQAVKQLGPLAGTDEVEFKPWSVPALQQALNDCDVVVLPFASGSVMSAGKSNNRALQALYAGRFVVAHPIDSYRELGDFCGLDDQLDRAVLAALAAPEAVTKKIARGQIHVAEHCAPEAIGRQWTELARNIRAAAPVRPASGAAAKAEVKSGGSMPDLSICWLVPRPAVYKGVDAPPPMPAARYRLDLTGLLQRGIHATYLDLEGSNPDTFVRACGGRMPDIVVLPAMALPDIVQAATWLRNAGVRLVLDLHDGHAAGPAGAEMLRQIAGQAVAAAAAAPGLALQYKRETGREALPVHDPYEGDAGAPRFAPAGERLKLAWYGEPSDLPELSGLLNALMPYAAEQPMTLNLVVSVPPQLAASLSGATEMSGGRLQVTVTPWSAAAQAAAIAGCDIVVLPSPPEPQAQTRGPQRLVAALRGGRLVVAGPTPAHEAFRDMAWIGPHLPDGLRWAKQNQAQVLQRIAAGQAIIEVRHSPLAAATQWAAVFDAAMRQATPQPLAAPAQRGIRLNLGCGDKILPGYVNCDALSSRGQGPKVDVQCDVTKRLPFVDGAAEEVLAVHVVEHIWRWEVADVLREWTRVLQPGGRMVLECPNLLSAAQELIRNPVAAAGPGPEGQRSMWVFYGDPRWRDPLMIHRWGYTPQSLAALMAEAGLVNVRQEPAQFKLREPRDMRIVGEKPL